MKISIFELAGQQEVLAGASSGRKLCALLWRAIPLQRDHRTIIQLDFSNLRVVTSSFLRESVVSFRGRLRTDRPNLYLVLANLGNEVEEELVELLHQMGEAFWVVEQNKLRLRLIGHLDPKVREALTWVEREREAEASTLWEKTRSKDGVGVTAWNNRLSFLSRQGLIVEDRRGKSKIYRLLQLGV